MNKYVHSFLKGWTKIVYSKRTNRGFRNDAEHFSLRYEPNWSRSLSTFQLHPGSRFETTVGGGGGGGGGKGVGAAAVL